MAHGDGVTSADMLRLIKRHGVEYVHELFLSRAATHRVAASDLAGWYLELHPPVSIIYRPTLVDPVLPHIIHRSELRLLRLRLLWAEPDLVVRAELQEIGQRLAAVDRAITTTWTQADPSVQLLVDVLALAEDPTFREEAARLCQKQGADWMTGVLDVTPAMINQGLNVKWILGAGIEPH